MRARCFYPGEKKKLREIKDKKLKEQQVDWHLAVKRAR